jgi:hypothetical protein
MRGIVSGDNRDRRFIINMDQTPVFFSMSSKRTFEVIEKKTIHIRTSTNDTSDDHGGRYAPPVFPYLQGEAKWPHCNKGVPIWRLPRWPLLQVPG